MKYFFSILFSLLFMSSHALAASFDCTKAATKVEKMICADAELSKLDDTLAASYKSALQSSANPALVKSEQVQWMKQNRNSCINSDCLRVTYQQRISELKRSSSAGGNPSLSPSSLNPPATITGSYEMSFQNSHGELELFDLGNGRVKFALLADLVIDVKMGNVRTGLTCGEISFTQNKAQYQNNDENCTLDFDLRGNILELTQKGSCGYGMGVTAEGQYKKSSSKKPKMEHCS